MRRSNGKTCDCERLPSRTCDSRSVRIRTVRASRHLPRCVSIVARDFPDSAVPYACCVSGSSMAGCSMCCTPVALRSKSSLVRDRRVFAMPAPQRPLPRGFATARWWRRAAQFLPSSLGPIRSTTERTDDCNIVRRASRLLQVQLNSSLYQDPYVDREPAAATSGFRVLSEPKRLKSRSALSSSRTFEWIQRAAIRAS